MTLDTDVLIVGAGLAGLGFGVQLVRKYRHRNFEIVEKSDHVGGTWFLNSYPGCGCDVASHYYSYSFEPNPKWSSKYPLQPEILAYLKGVETKYDITKHIKFHSAVVSAYWQNSSATWLVIVEDLQTKIRTPRRCKILISAVGILSVPNESGIPGADSFNGRLFHTARWDHSFDWKDKNVIVVGNGCSASQAIPILSKGDKAVRKLTQFARQAQWIFERPNPQYSELFKWTMRWIPFAMRVYRLAQNYYAEMDFYSFDTVEGAKLRGLYAAAGSDYIRRTAPDRYHDFLVPTTEVGCVRRVMDTNYLDSLNRSNVELVHDDPIDHFVHNGARTKSGRVIEADAVILANGFQVQKPLVTLNVYGENGISVDEHWDKFSEGVASAYYGTCLSEFPNFFIMMGPNTASGHGSVLYITECQINFALRAMKPILRNLWTERSVVPILGQKADIVKVKAASEQSDIDDVQRRCQNLVWASGCTSWAVDPTTKRNITMYPDFQYKYWLRSLTVPWRDFEVLRSQPSQAKSASNNYAALKKWSWSAIAVIGAALAFKIGTS